MERQQQITICVILTLRSNVISLQIKLNLNWLFYEFPLTCLYDRQYMYYFWVFLCFGFKVCPIPTSRGECMHPMHGGISLRRGLIPRFLVIFHLDLAFYWLVLYHDSGTIGLGKSVSRELITRSTNCSKQPITITQSL